MATAADSWVSNTAHQCFRHQAIVVGDPKSRNLFIKYRVFILTCLNFSHLQSTLHLMQYTYRDTFFHCSKQFLNSLILMPFSASVVFCFTSSTSATHFPSRTFFIWGNKKIHSRWDPVNREGEAQGSCRFWSKTTEHSVWCGRVHS